MLKRNLLFVIGTLILLCGSVNADTVAYWQFDEGPAGTAVPHGGEGDGVFYPGTLDSSGNGNDLSVWAEGWAGYGYRISVATPITPQTAQPNLYSVQNTGDYPALFSTSEMLRTMEPLAWTVEVAFMPENGGWRTIVGRDSRGATNDNADLSALYLQITPENALAIKFTDKLGYWHVAQTPDGYIEGWNFPDSSNGKWYYAAAVSDGATLSLYVADTTTGTGYELAAQTDISLSGSSDTRLTSGEKDGTWTDWEAGNWSVGRGLYGGGHGDRAYGFIDEVRISDSALDPTEFLFSGGLVVGPKDQAIFEELDDTATFTVDITAKPYGESISEVIWYKDSPSLDTPIVEDGSKYVITTDNAQSVLKVYDVTGDDVANYYALVIFSDNSSVYSTNTATLSFSNGLVHRYSFSGDLTDSISGANGELNDPNNDAFYDESNSQLVLNNRNMLPLDDPNNFMYVDLPDGLVSSLGNYATFELWLTPNSNQNWTTLMSFGQRNQPIYTGTTTGIFMQMNRAENSDGPAFASRLSNYQVAMTSSPALTLGEEVMLSVVWNGNNDTMQFYINGEQVDSTGLIMSLSDLNDIDNWLGLGYWNDPIPNWQINEFRIYDFPLPNYYISAHYQAGPDTTEVELRPGISIPQDIAVYPLLRDDDADAAMFTANIFDVPTGATVSSVQWYFDPDPAASGDEVALAEGAKYDIGFTQTDTSLVVNDVDASDDGYYFVVVTLSTGAYDASGSGKLTVSQGLVHRWNFNGSLADSVSGADGVIHDPDGKASFVDGQLLLDNDNIRPNTDPNAAYVELPGGIISALDNYMTIEIWVTPNRKISPTTWVNLFAFGEDNDGDQDDYSGGYGLIGTLQSGERDAPLFTFEPVAGRQQRLQVNNPVEEGKEFMLAATWDGNTDTATVYVIDENGVQTVSNSTLGSLSEVNDVDNYIGINWWNDYLLNASINEMRIYDYALTAPWIEEHYIVGPDVLDVNPCLEYPTLDLDGDCQVNMTDLAIFVGQWLDCGRLTYCD